MDLRCPYCNQDNPENSRFCGQCRQPIPGPASGQRYCVSCGRAIGWDVNVCPYCGWDYRSPQALSEPDVSGGMRALLYILSVMIPLAGFIIGAIYCTKPERVYRHVGKICLILGVVGILLSVVLAALLYVMVLGFGGVTSEAPVLDIVRVAYPAGYRFDLTTPTETTAWSDVGIMLSSATDSPVYWGNFTTGDLVEPYGPAVWHYGSASTLGDMEVWLNITDLEGDGQIGWGDYFTITCGGLPSWSTGTTYSVSLIYEPLDMQMATTHFTG